MDFDDQYTVRKGKVGEAIVKDFLESMGFVVYRPVTKGKAHSFDNLAIRNRKDVMIAEVKTKPRRMYYPDTGINLRHYNEYLEVVERHNIPVFIFFVDEWMKQVYGNWLSFLKMPRLIAGVRGGVSYPLIEGEVIYFPMEAMEKIKELDEEQVRELKEYSTRNPDYD